MKETKIIEFEKLSSRHIDEGWLKWVTRVNPEMYTEFSRNPPNREDLERILSKTSTNDIWFAALWRDSENESKKSRYFANVHISDISWIDRRCTFGRLIGDEESRGKGLGTLLTKTIIKYCFNVLGMHKVTAGCLSNNIAAQKSNLKAGMKREAILEKDRFFQGKFIDVHCFSALTEDWCL